MDPTVLQIQRRKLRYIGNTLRDPEGTIEEEAISWNPQGARRKGRSRDFEKDSIRRGSDIRKKLQTK